jgi:amino acid transporter
MTSFDKKINTPMVQAAAVLVVAVFLMFLGWAFQATGLLRPDRLFAWSIATALMLFFALVNSLLSLRADSFAKYWGASMYSYLGLAFGNGLAAWLFSGVRLSEAESYQWIYTVVTVGFIVFLLMVNFMKKIVGFAQREEWNQPRRRR